MIEKSANLTTGWHICFLHMCQIVGANSPKVNFVKISKIHHHAAVAASAAAASTASVVKTLYDRMKVVFPSPLLLFLL